MATHSSILAWEIPWMEEPGELQSMGSQRVEHDSMTNTFMMGIQACLDIIDYGFLGSCANFLKLNPFSFIFLLPVLLRYN